MKRLFFAVVALSLFATSCAKDEAAAPEATAKTKTVTFSVKAPELKTRAAGDGTQATTLYYAFYDETGMLADLENTAPTGMTWDGIAGETITVTLVDGKEYTALFWAQNAAAPYTIDMANKNVSIDYSEAVGNSEVYDAFYAHVTAFEPKDITEDQNVVLKRPFAQVNIGAPTKDIEDAVKAGLDVESVKVSVTGVGNSIDLATGVVTEEANPVVFNWSTVGATTKNFTVNSANVEYTILSTNYVLVGNADKKLGNVNFYMSEEAVEDDATYANPINRDWSSVPIEVNHRTFILGDIVTNSNALTYIVKIAPGFDNEGSPIVHP